MPRSEGERPRPPLRPTKVNPPPADGRPARGGPRPGKPGWRDGPPPPQSARGPRPFGPRTGGPKSKSFARPSIAAARGDTRLPPSVKIIHEDEHLIVADKPPGLLSAGMPGEDVPSLFEMLKRHVRARSKGPRPRPKPGESRRLGQGVFVIHRLDREASGLLVFSKNETAFVALKEAFKQRKPHRLYLALVDGVMGEVGFQTTIQSHLVERGDGRVESIGHAAFRGPHGAKPRPGSQDESAKLAITHVRVVAVGNGCSLLQVRLETGRKHQIRVHLADRGHPVVGDERYGAKTNPIDRLGLHALELGFTHPGTGQTVRYRSAIPAAFYRAVGAKPPLNAEDEPTPEGQRAADTTYTLAGEDTSWQHVAGWYDQLHAEKRSDHYDRTIIPGTVRLVSPQPGERVLDVACGQGVVTRALAAAMTDAGGGRIIGVDAAAALVAAAKAHAPEGERPAAVEYHVADARALRTLPLEPADFDAAACVMALTNIDPLEPVLRAVADLLKPGGRFIAVLSHPAFRIPKQTAWGWDQKAQKQFRRVDAYLSPGQTSIQMNPGEAASGAAPVTTWTFHRPLSAYVNALASVGLRLDRLEEWAGQRVSEPGPRAEEENRIRREIPLFVALRAIK